MNRAPGYPSDLARFNTGRVIGLREALATYLKTGKWTYGRQVLSEVEPGSEEWRSAEFGIAVIMMGDPVGIIRRRDAKK